MGNGAAKATDRLVTPGMRLNMEFLRKSIACFESRTEGLLSCERRLDAMHGAAVGRRADLLDFDAKIDETVRCMSRLAEQARGKKPFGWPKADRQKFDGIVETGTRLVIGMWEDSKVIKKHLKAQSRNMGEIGALMRKEEESALHLYRQFERGEAILRNMDEGGKAADVAVRAEFRACLKTAMDRGSESTDVKKRVAAKVARRGAQERECLEIARDLAEKHLRLYNMMLEMGAGAGGTRGRLRRAWRGLWGAGAPAAR